MLTKNEIKHIKSLQYKKNRNLYNCFVVEGEKSVEEILDSGFEIISVYAENEWINKHSNENDIQIKNVNSKELKSISSLTTPNKVLAVIKKQSNNFDIGELKEKLTIVLDRIQDPGNMGTIIRIADWFGIQNIICSVDSVEVYNPKVIQASMGSIFRVNVFYKELTPFIKKVKNETNLTVYGTLLNGENIYTKKLKTNGIIIFGNESQGLSKKLIPLIDDKLTIPNFSKGAHKTESLNMAVAAAITCSEFKRK